jgi:nucleotide-binding universal stress UspA family protein
MRPIRKILVPTDFGEVASYALDRAIELAAKLDATVTVVHVYEYSLWAIDTGRASAPDMARRIKQAASEALSAAIQRRSSGGVVVSGALREGIAWSEIVEEARALDADLIVIGTHGRRSLPRALLGSVAEKVVRHAGMPVLTIHLPSEEHPAKVSGGSKKRSASHSHHEEDILAVSGAIAGGTTGAFAGPPGAAAGAVIGAGIGMAIGKALDDEDDRRKQAEAKLDREIGVVGGNLGLAQPRRAS